MEECSPQSSLFCLPRPGEGRESFFGTGIGWDPRKTYNSPFHLSLTTANVVCAKLDVGYNDGGGGDDGDDGQALGGEN